MFEFKLPDLGEGVHEGQVINVLVKEGDALAENQEMLEVETDKAAVVIPSPRAGRVAKINVTPGQTVHVGEVMIVIDDGSVAAVGTKTAAKTPAAAPAAKASASKPAPAAASAAPGRNGGAGGGLFEFKLPDLGEGVHEGQVINVLVKENAPIAENQEMLEVETDKAAVVIPSPRAGTVAKINVAPGQTVRVGEVMLVIAEAGASVAPSVPAPARAGGAVAAAAHATVPSAREAARRDPMPAPAAAAVALASPTQGGPIPAAPVVRKLAREMGVDLRLVPPSGPNGRVLRADVERFARGGPAASPAARPTSHTSAPAAAAGATISLPAEALPDFAQYGPVRREKPSQIRKTIARQMTRAWHNVPRVTHGDEVDITELERNRKDMNNGVKDALGKITMTAIVLKAVAAGLREFPQFNVSYDVAAEEIVHKDYIHLGVAVDSPRGLVVPVVRDVDRKPLPQVARELNDVAERVRQGKFEVNELRGATFTVTNVGALGGTFSTPMVNFPEVAIFGLGKSKWTPVVMEDQKTILPRLIMPVFLSFDHRVCDGADAARFTRAIIGGLQNPLRLISF